MLQTLFHIPLWPFQGYWLWMWLGLMTLAAVVHGLRKGWGEALSTWGPPWLLLWVFSQFLLGQLVDYGIDPDNPTQVVPWGIAVRGYGLMMLMGIVAGVLLAVHRCHPEGVTADQVLSLALHLIVFGIVGARLFYVIQYWDNYAGEPFPQRLVSMLNMTKGGLVVLGSFFGSLVGLAYWSYRQQIRVLKLADLIAPSLLLGYSLGRIGCLLNGCCFGGYCEWPDLAVQFPAGSPPYLHQIEDGRLLGVTTVEANPTGPDDGSVPRHWRIVTEVPADSRGARLGLQVGEAIFLQPNAGSLSDPRVGFEKVLRAGVAGVDLPPPLILHRRNHPPRPMLWPELPAVAEPIHPTQVYSSVTALILALIVGFSYRVRRFDGQSFAWLLLLYGVARFIIEWIRQDEPGQFGTDLTISQWGCLALIVAGVVLMVWGCLRGTKLAPGAMA
jgi:phosphatidylglycerol---prolipoprotein diacylglyceryl transferase